MECLRHEYVLSVLIEVVKRLAVNPDLLEAETRIELDPIVEVGVCGRELRRASDSG